MDLPRVLTPKEVARILKRSESWVYENATRLGAVKIKGSWIFTVDGLKGALAPKFNDQEQRKTTTAKLAKKTRAKRRPSVHLDTDPAEHGIADLMYIIGAKPKSEPEPELEAEEKLSPEEWQKILAVRKALAGIKKQD